jgi:hypothetical protein
MIKYAGICCRQTRPFYDITLIFENRDYYEQSPAESTKGLGIGLIAVKDDHRGRRAAPEDNKW